MACGGGGLGQPVGWLAIAGQRQRDRDVNITRQGVVWLPVVAAGPGEQALVARIAAASLALYQDLLELGCGRASRSPAAMVRSVTAASASSCG